MFAIAKSKARIFLKKIFQKECAFLRVHAEKVWRDFACSTQRKGSPATSEWFYTDLRAYARSIAVSQHDPRKVASRQRSRVGTFSAARMSIIGIFHAIAGHVVRQYAARNGTERIIYRNSHTYIMSLKSVA